MARLFRPVTMTISVRPDATASSTTYWIVGLSTIGSISFGWAFVAGRNLVPRPAAGNTALRTVMTPPLTPATPGQADEPATRPHRSGDAAERPVLAIERLSDAPPQLGLRVEPAGRIHAHGQSQDGVTPGEFDDTLRARCFQRGAALAHPLGADALERRERPVDRDLARHGDVHRRGGPARRVVHELAELSAR